MTGVRTALGAGLLVALIAGTLADVPEPRVHREMGGYHVLATDFHVHSFPFSWSTLSAFDTVLDARHQGLDAIAITPHNHVWVARLGRWFANAIGGPIVVVGEEVTAPGYHMLAVGIDELVSNRLSAEDAIDEIHRQGGVAIAAHPYRDFWPGLDAEAMRKLDGSEVVRPEAYLGEEPIAELVEFNQRAGATAIGATDFHGTLPVGYSRTYVFARERSASAIVDAVRNGRTVVYDRERAYGDASLIALAQASGGLPRTPPVLPPPGLLAGFSRALAVLTLLAVVLFNRW
jgi:predicted metal-dependent phosphoesterase TrpH